MIDLCCEAIAPEHATHGFQAVTGMAHRIFDRQSGK